MKPLSPRQRRHKKTKRSILEIAKKLVAQHGFENISLREIARLADYSPAGLYEYFSNKEELLRALSDMVRKSMIAALNKVPDDLTAKDRLIELSLAYIDFALENEELFKLMNNIPSERKSLDEPVSAASPYRIFQEAVHEFIETHAISLQEVHGAEEITYGLWGLIHGLATLQISHLRNFEADFEHGNRRTIERYLAGVAKDD